MTARQKRQWFWFILVIEVIPAAIEILMLGAALFVQGMVMK